MKRKAAGQRSEFPLPPGMVVHSQKGKRVFKGIRFDMFQWQQKMFNGKTATFETLVRKPSVVVIPVEGENVYLIRERQPHWKKASIGFIAGAVEDGETLEEAARRELREEAGIECEHMDLVFSSQFIRSIEWSGYTFVARGLTHTGKTAFDGGEDIQVKKVSIAELIRLVRRKAFSFPPLFLEHWLIRDKEDMIRKLLKKPRLLF